MAKPKKTSMLARQRQLRQQQQQVRNASSNKLPSRGNSGGGNGGGLGRRPESADSRPGGAVAQSRSSLGSRRSQPRTQRGGSLETAGPTIDVKARPPRSAPPITNPNGTTGAQARQLANALPNRRPAQPGTSRPQPVSRAAAAQAKAAEAAKGTSSTNVRTGQPAKIKGGGRLIGGGNAAILALQAANAVQDKLMTPEQLKVKRANEISRDNIQFPKFPSGQKKSQPPAPRPSVSSLTDKGGIFNVNKTGNVKVTPKKKEESNNTSTSSQQPARQAPQERRSNPIPKASSSNTKPAQPTEKAYGESGKDLYMASKKNNPLMQRTFGYQTGDGPSSKTEAPSSKPIPKNGSATQDSKVTFTPEEQKKGSQAFNQDSINRLGKRETAEEKRKRQAKGGMA